MEPIGLCGGGLLTLALILIAIVGVAVLGGGIVLLLVKLGVIVDRWSKPEDRGESEHYTLDQSSAPRPEDRDAAPDTNGENKTQNPERN